MFKKGEISSLLLLMLKLMLLILKLKEKHLKFFIKYFIKCSCPFCAGEIKNKIFSLLILLLLLLNKDEK